MRDWEYYHTFDKKDKGSRIQSSNLDNLNGLLSSLFLLVSQTTRGIASHPSTLPNPSFLTNIA
jgi:hypothetical protein